MESFMTKAAKIDRILARAPKLDKSLRVEKPEFLARQNAVMEGLAARDVDCGIVYSDEHYCGDVPYLGGCTNLSIEPIAGILGVNGFHILAGLEGGYVAEQLGYRSGAFIHKVEMLKLADEEYPIEAEHVEDVLYQAAGRVPKTIGLLTPREVLPVKIGRAHV